MVTHKLKIKPIHLVRIIQGDKQFELRKNDRYFQVGDKLSFEVLEDKDFDIWDYAEYIPVYEITCIYSGYGLEDGYVALGIRIVE